MTAVLTLLGIIAYLYLYSALLPKTFLAIAPGRHQISGLYFLFLNGLFVLPALMIVAIVGPENIRILHYVSRDSVLDINLIVIYSLISFVVCLFWISTVMGRRLMYDMRLVYNDIGRAGAKSRTINFTRLAMISIPVSILVNVFIFGGQHALFSAAFYDLNPGAIRHANESSAFSAYVKHYFLIISLIMAPILALPIYDRRKKERLFAFLLIFIALTSHGSKSPFIFFLVTYVFAKFEKTVINSGAKHGYRLLGPKKIAMIAFGLMSVFLLFYFVVTKLFLTAGNPFWDYFWNRAFVGQMAGIYEQFNLFLYDTAFSWHGVPFASLFIDYPNFHKELMLVSENRIDPNRIGIKVTFFAAEAYAMFKWLGVIFAPMMMAIQFVISFLVLKKFLNFFVFRSDELAKYVTSFFFVSYFSFTDGISEMMLFKGLVFIFVLLTPIMISVVLLGTLLPRRAEVNQKGYI